MHLEFQRFLLEYIADRDVVSEWQSTEQGQWVMEHAQNLTWYQGHCEATYRPVWMLAGDLDGVELTEYLLRWANPKSS